MKNLRNKIAFPILSSIIILSVAACKSDKSDPKLNTEAAANRVEEVTKEVYPKYNGAETYQSIEGMEINKIGMNNKGYIWIITDIKDQNLFPVLDGYEVKYKYKKNKGNITLTLPEILEKKTSLTLQLFNKENKTKSQEYLLNLDFKNKKLSLADGS